VGDKKTPLLELLAVSKTYPGVKALDRVDLSVGRGEVLALIGENGAGKSTLMKILGGVVEPTEGGIRIDGTRASSSEAVRPIAVNTAKRSPKLPQVATYREQGFPEKVFMLKGWLGLLGPDGLPAEIVSRISKLILEGADSPRLKQIYETFGLIEKPTTPEEFLNLYREEGPVMIAIAKELGVSLD